MVATIDNEVRAFIWDDTSGMRALGHLGGGYSYAQDINNTGQVVGGSTSPDGEVHAFLCDDTTTPSTMRDLGDLGGGYSSARRINSAGHVVGVSTTAEGHQHAFIWDTIEMHDLGTLGGETSAAFGINDSGRIARWATTDIGPFRHAVLWTPST